MANAAEEHLTSFRWEVVNPFLPSTRELKASFFSGSPTVAQWKVTFRTIYCRINRLLFAFRLKFERMFDRRYEITADNIFITISLNNERITTKDETNYCFDRDNRYTYYYYKAAYLQPQTSPHILVFNIQILLSGMVRGIGNGVIFNTDDLRWLSEDFRKLLVAQNYCNMILTTNDNPLPIRVHSYIMRARWDNFFEFHHYDQADQRPVEVKISTHLILNILLFMYCGEFELNWPDWTDPAYTSQLFQVIYRYKLYHLHKAFAQHDLSQVRLNRDLVFIGVRRFRIHFVDGDQIRANSPVWNIEQPDNGYRIFFQILVRDRNNRPWLSYFLESRSVGEIHAHVYLEVIKEVEPNVFQPVCYLEDREHKIYPNTSVDSGRILFLGSPEIFGDHNLSSPGGPDIRFFIRCYMTITNGIRFEQIRSVGGHHQPASERHLALSDAMHGLLRRRTGHDMTANSSPIGLAEVLERVHKGIFATRVPDFFRGIEDHNEGESLRDSVTVLLSGDALPVVIDYIYTGRVFPIPTRLLPEIEDFARDTGFQALQDLLRRIRNADRRNE